MATKQKQVTVYLPPDVSQEIESERFGDPVSAIIVARLRQAYAMGPVAAAPLSPTAEAELRRKQADAEIAERRAAILAASYIKKEIVKACVQNSFAVIRSRINAIPASIMGLTPEQYADANKAVQDCLTDLSASPPKHWDDLAQEAAEDFA